MKRWLVMSLICVLCLMVVITAFPVSAAEVSGTYGDNINWVLEDGVLTLSGIGEMTQLLAVTPWKDYSNEITKVVIEEGVTSVAKRAFRSCTALTTVTFPESLTALGEEAFAYCRALKTIYFLGDIPDVRNSTFKEVKASAYYLPENESWRNGSPVSLGGSLFVQPYYEEQKCGDNLLWSFANGVLTISGTGEMYSPAYMEMWAEHRLDIKKVVIESGVTGISRQAFSLHTALEEVSIPETVTSIGTTAFAMCSSLKKITIPNSVKTIGDMCFSNCAALEEVHIGSGVTQIDESAFELCPKLKEIYFYGDAPRVGFGVLTREAVTAYYPAGNSSWTEAVRKSYGEDITWVEKCLSGHREETVTGKAATCSEEGLTDGKRCAVCGVVTVPQQKISVNDKHSYGEWETVKAPTEQEEGYKQRTCSLCGKKDGQPITKLQSSGTEPSTTPPTEEPTSPSTAPSTDASTEPSGTKPTEPVEIKPGSDGNGLIWLWICLGIAVLGGGGAAAFLLIKRKK